MSFQIVPATLDRSCKVREQINGSYLDELQWKFSIAEDEFVCAHKVVLEQITKCREAIKIAEGLERKFHIARSTLEAANRSNLNEMKKLKNTQEISSFELSDGPLKRDFDVMLDI
tara:strand:- start:1166 stop:1510 length:345 start_codon:yes stop_codon:yes gene_type:complete